MWPLDVLVSAALIVFLVSILTLSFLLLIFWLAYDTKP